MNPALRKFLKRLGDRRVVGAVEWLLQPAKRRSWGGAFNGQRGRIEFFEELLLAFEPQVIIETGTFRGTTTAYLASRSGVPVRSVESSPRAYGFARMNLIGRSNVSLELGDSSRFLERLVRDEWIQERRCFFYLDAHWGAELPLMRELDTVLSSHLKAIVAIDDFRVPWDSGYGFDDYGPGARLDQPLIAPVITRFGARTFFPVLPSDEESGARRGMCCVAAEARAVSSLKAMLSVRPASVGEAIDVERVKE